MSVPAPLRIPPGRRALLLGLLCMGGAAPASAAGLSLGIGGELVADSADGVDTLSGSKAGLGGGLRVPLRVDLGQGAWFKTTLSSALTRGQDRVEWSEGDAGVRYFSDDHWTLCNSSALMVGPGIDIGRSEDLVPYLGAQAGALLLTSWHSFEGPAAVLLDPAQGDVTRSTYIEPWTRQLAPAVDLALGLRMGRVAPFAMELEAGYTVSFFSEATLQKARPELGAIRTAFGLNALRFGAGASFSL